MILEVFIEGKRLDLFNDENIELNRSVQDIKDISKIYTDFTQSFTVPASKNNNKIFKHFERPEIDDGFDTRIKKDAALTINTLDFLNGRMRLEKVQTEYSRPVSYTIIFFGNLVSIKDLVGEDTLADLEWLDQFNHPYNATKVTEGLLIGLFFDIDTISERVITYPLLSSVRRFIFNSDGLNQTDTDTFVNIAMDNVGQPNGIKYTDLKPAITLKQIIRGIQEKYGLIFSGFFDKKEFTDLYMWLSENSGYMRAGGKSLMPFPDNEVMIDGFIDVSIISPEEGSPRFSDKYTYDITITPTDANLTYSVIVENNGQATKQVNDIKGEYVVSGSIVKWPDDQRTDFKVGFYLISEEAIIYDADAEVIKTTRTSLASDLTPAGTVSTSTYTSDLFSQSINTVVKLREQLPEITVEDFLSGLFKMFNLTVVPKDGILYVESLEEWYTKGRIIDVSEYVDNSDVPVEKGTLLKQINLKFEEGKSFLIEEFINNFGRSYGDLELILRDSYGDRLDGDTLDISLPFEQMIYERLTDIDTDLLTKVQYGYVVDKDEKPYKIKPHILYLNHTNLDAGLGISVLGESQEAQPIFTYFKPSHIGGLNLEQFATVFNADFEEFSGDAITSNLLTNYYLDYLTDIFSSKRRVFSFKAKLSTKLIQGLQLNDRLVIQGRRYIINSMNINLITKDADLELINDVYRGETQESLTNKMLLSSYYMEFDNTAQSVSFTYTTNEEVNYLKYLAVEDLGSGIDWIDPWQRFNTINYTVAENTSGLDRYTAIKLTGRSLTDTYHIVKQNA